MPHRPLRSCLAAAFALSAPVALAQVATVPAAISGVAADPSGAKISHAAVHIENDRIKRDALTDEAGRFSVDLPPGTYKMDVLSDGFEPFIRENIVITAGKPLKPLAVTLRIATENEVVTVAANNGVSTDASDNASALVFDKNKLADLSDDDATLQQQVLALAGGDGQNPPQIYVDGFSGGRFPPKSSIREIRINQNPYSAQYDGLGFGRVEIFTKPGSDKLHGFFFVQGNDRSFNSRNPFAGAQPPYHTLNLDGNISGPLGKNTSFFLSGNYFDQENNAVINAVTLDGSNNQTTLSQALPDPQKFHTFAGRIDRQLSKNNTFTGRYEYNQNVATNSGIGQLVLASQGNNTTNTTQTLQLGNTEVIGAHLINETRFQYVRTRLNQSPVSTAPTLIVQGAFSGGGSSSQLSRDNQDHYEFQDYLSISKGKHFIRTGLRYRFQRDANLSTGNYNGQYTFPDLATYQITQKGIAAGLTPAQIRASGGGASQFTLTAGQPSAVITVGDIGIYADDEWKITKNLTLNLGLRFESQTAIPDHSDPAPRLGFAYAVKQRDKHPAWFVLRGGAGVFYNRFDSSAILTAARQNGITQQSYFIQNPDTYPTIPSVSSLTGVTPTVYSISPNLRSQYDIVSGLSIERSLGKIGNVTLNYVNVRTVHKFISLNINAPLPGTYNPAVPNSGTRPFGGTQNIYQYTSAGEGRGNRLFSNYNLNPNKWLDIWGFYLLQFGTSDSAGTSSFPTNSYNVHADYGRANYVVTNRLFTGGDLHLPKGIFLGAFLAARGARTFNITTGADNNGDSIYNDRPSFATDLTRPSVVRTALGNFDTNPIPGQTIVPINYGRGPLFISLQMQVSKSIKFGPRRAEEADASAPTPPPAKPGTPIHKPDPAYELTFAAEGQNVFNRVNGSVPIGVLTSPFFGKSITLESGFFNNSAANRTVSLHAFFRF